MQFVVVIEGAPQATDKHTAVGPVEQHVEQQPVLLRVLVARDATHSEEGDDLLLAFY